MNFLLHFHSSAVNDVRMMLLLLLIFTSFTIYRYIMSKQESLSKSFYIYIKCLFLLWFVFLSFFYLWHSFTLLRLLFISICITIILQYSQFSFLTSPHYYCTTDTHTKHVWAEVRSENVISYCFRKNTKRFAKLLNILFLKKKYHFLLKVSLEVSHSFTDPFSLLISFYFFFVSYALCCVVWSEGSTLIAHALYVVIIETGSLCNVV